MSLRLLTLLAAVELASLSGLLVNLTTVHLPGVASILGPLHGCAYIASIIGTAMNARPMSLPTLLSVIPGIGGTLAAAALRRRANGTATVRQER